MSRRSVITEEMAEAMLESYRMAPGNASAAARASGCDVRTCRKAYSHGLKSTPTPRYSRPFQEIIADEQVEARAKLHAQEAEATSIAHQMEGERRAGVQADAHTDAAKQRAQEEQLVRNARAATIVLLNTVTNIAAGANALGAKVKASLVAQASNEEALTIAETKGVVSLISRLGTTLRQCNDAGQKAMEMSRLLVGEPTNIIGHRNLDNITVGEAQQRIAAAARAMDELEAKGIEMVDGSTHAADPSVH